MADEERSELPKRNTSTLLASVKVNRENRQSGADITHILKAFYTI